MKTDIGTETVQVLTHEMLPGVSVTFEYITPDLAELYLSSLDETQRPRSPRKVSDYISDKLNGLWKFNGDTLCFSTNSFGEEVLIDGQHRLMAIAESRQGSVELVVRGLGEGVIDVQDIGATRTFYTWLQRYPKPKNSVICRQVTGMIWQWQHGNYGYRTAGRVAYPEFLGRNGTAPQLQQVWRFYDKDIESAAQHGLRLANKVRPRRNSVLRGPLALAWLMLRQIDIDKAERFFWIFTDEDVRVGQDANRPIRILYKELGDAIDNPADREWVLLHYIFQAWNMWITEVPPTGRGLNFRRPPRPESHILAMPVGLPRIPGKPSSAEPFEFFTVDVNGKPIMPPPADMPGGNASVSDDEDDEEIK